MEREGAGGPGEARATAGPPGGKGKKLLEPADAERAARGSSHPCRDTASPV